MNASDSPAPDVERPADAAGAASVRASGRWRRYRCRVAVVLASLVGSVLFGFLGFSVSLQALEWMHPSGHVFITVDGNKIYLEQPNILVTPVRTSHSAVSPSSTSIMTPAVPEVTPSRSIPTVTPETTTTITPSAPQVPLPPVRIAIDRLGIDYPVVVASNAHLPRQRLVGWYYGSALPGTAGNTVLFGHVDGSGATFARLHELGVGEEIRIITAREEHTYVVDWLEEVNPTDIEVIGPSNDAVVTLITCSGEWSPAERTYDKRLVVRAHYADVHALDSAATGT